MDRAFGKLRGELKSMGIGDNTILWYCSDNGGLDEVSSTGGRANKGSIYEGGLRVPALLEWPARIRQSAVTDVPFNTTDMYPTLLEITGASVDNQPPLDGVSLVSLFDGAMTERPEPMGFWSYPSGVKSGVAGERWMQDMLEAQREGTAVEEESPLLLGAGVIKKQYAEDDFLGHAAWLDWPWKLHRIQAENGRVYWALYDLVTDPEERHNLRSEHADKVEIMKGCSSAITAGRDAQSQQRDCPRESASRDCPFLGGLRRN